MDQMNFDSYMDGKKELIHCELGSDFHWIRITSGHTPSKARKRVQFILGGYDFLYVNRILKDEIKSSFNGLIKTITWKEAMGHGEQSEAEQGSAAVTARNDAR